MAGHKAPNSNMVSVNLVVFIKNGFVSLFVLITVYDVCFILRITGVFDKYLALAPMESEALHSSFIFFYSLLVRQIKDYRPCGPAAYITREGRLTQLLVIWQRSRKIHSYFTALTLFVYWFISFVFYAKVTIHVSSFLPCWAISFSSPPSPIVLFF